MSNDGGIGLLQRFEARMKASLRPIGIMHLTDEAAKTVAAKWGLRSEMNPNILLALWHRLKDEGVKSEFAKTECRALAFLLMQGADEDHPDFLGDSELFRHGVSVIKEHRHLLALRMLVSAFFARYALVRARAPGLILSIEIAAREEGGICVKLAAEGFFSEDAPERVARKLPTDKAFTRSIEEMSGALILPHDSFSDEVWGRRIRLYPELLRDARSDVNALLAAFSLIREESSDANGRFRKLAEFDLFLDAVIPPLLSGAGVNDRPPILKPEVEAGLIRLFEALIGPKCRENAELWTKIEAKIGPVKTLEEAFDLVAALPGVNFGQWTKRQAFWRRYWSTGRITRCRLYSPRSKRYAYVERFRNTHPELCRTWGVIEERSSTEIMLLLEIFGGLVASEFSHDGKLRINASDPLRVSLDRQRIDWYDLRDWGGDWGEDGAFNISHASARWTAETDGYIEDRTGLNRPTSY